MKLGLALSGGGVKGAAHIGAIKALEENNIKIAMIGGTSSGSIVATLYAMGYSPDQILKLFQYFSKMILKNSPKYTHPDGKSSLSIQVGGFLSGENIGAAIKEAAEFKRMKTLQDLLIPVAIPTVDIINGEKYVFTNKKERKDPHYITDSNIGVAVRASSSYPGVFAPCVYQEHKFVDGGILDNIPVDEVKKLGADKVMAIRFSLNRHSKPKGVLGVAMKSVDIMFDKRAANELKESDYVLEINTKEATVFNIKKIEECYQYGYEQTILKIPEIRKVLQTYE